MPSNEYVDLEKFHGMNNLLLRKKANEIMAQIKKSDNPMAIIESILEQSAKAYATDNKYIQVQANVILTTLFENLRSNKFKGVSEKQSISMMNKASATVNRIREVRKQQEAQKNKERLSNVAGRAKDVLSPFIPTPRTLLNAAKISNPILGAAIDGASKLGGGNESSEKLFENSATGSSYQYSNEPENPGNSGSSLNDSVQYEQLDTLNELLAVTKRVWGDNQEVQKEQNENLESIKEDSESQAENLERMREDEKRDEFANAERMRESENDSLFSKFFKKGKKGKDPDEGYGDDIAEGAVQGLVAGSIGALGRGLGMAFKSIPVIGAVVGGVMAMADTFSKDKNLKNFGKETLEGGEIISGFVSNFLGTFGDIVDMFLGTNFGPQIKKKAFKWIGDFFAPFNEAVNTIVTDVKDVFTDFSLSNVLKLAKNSFYYGITSIFRSIDAIFGTDIGGFIDQTWESVKTVVAMMPTKLADMMLAVDNFFTETIPNTVQSIWDKITGVFTEVIPSIMNDIITSIKEFFTIDNIKTIISNAYSDSFLAKGVNAVTDMVDGSDNLKGRGQRKAEARNVELMEQKTSRRGQLAEKPEKNIPSANNTNVTQINNNSKNESVVNIPIASPHPTDNYAAAIA